MRTLLIANRGEIARRIIRTARRLGLNTVAVYSEADAEAPHVREADRAVLIGPAPAAESYLRVERILEAARATGADAVHPGYGFLSENARFAAAVTDAGLIWVGPPPGAIEAMGLKDAAKRLMREAGVPVTPGYQGEDQSLARLEHAARAIGYPLLIKAVAGGGGKGMRRVDGPADFAEALVGAQREAARAFGDDGVLIEKYIASARHVEVQVFADRAGHTIHLFERDCSLQRRHQKVIEEAPAPGLSDALRQRMGAAAVAAAKAVSYVGAGTVEFIVDVAERDNHGDPHFYFMEMNTRLQVEHPVTEAVTGLDLVEWQLRVANGEPLPLRQEEVRLYGHAVEARLYAEDADAGFLPQIGRLARLRFPEGAGIRIDSGVEEGQEVTPFYDPMIAKVVAHGSDRAAALARLVEALDATEVEGLTTNRAFLARLAAHPAFIAGEMTTGFIATHEAALRPPEAAPAEVLGAAALWLASAPPEPGPFAAMGPFRLNLPYLRHVDLWEGERHHRPSIAGGVVAGLDGGADLAGARVEGSVVRLPGGGHLHVFRAGTGGRRALRLSRAGQSWRVELDPPPPAAAADASFSGRVSAPMPGRVLSLGVKEGQAVELGDRLLVLEAMKMEHRISAPAAGRVTRVAVSEGDQVAEGAPLVEIELVA